ncbi:MAG: leucine-rich repeat protein [Clostridia bacterium]
MKKQAFLSLMAQLSEQVSLNTALKVRNDELKTQLSAAQADAQDHWLHSATKLRADAAAFRKETEQQAIQDRNHLLAAAREKAKSLLQNALTLSNEIVEKAQVQSANILRQATEDAACQREAMLAEAADRMNANQERLTRSMDWLSQESALLLTDIQRQMLIFSQAMQNTVSTVLNNELSLDEHQLVFSDKLAEAIKRTPAIIQRESSEIGRLLVHNIAEFQKLGATGFRCNALLTSVSLPEGVTEVPASFFFGCTNLQAIDLPTSVTTIGDYAFFGCAALNKIQLPIGLVHVGEFAFSACTSLIEIDIPATVHTVSTAAFRNCDALRSIRFSPKSSLMTLGTHAFQNCASLANLILPALVNRVPTSLFYGCKALTQMDIPESVEAIDGYAFCGCESLKQLTLHSGRTLLSPSAFIDAPLVKLALVGHGVLRQPAGEQAQQAVDLLVTPAVSIADSQQATQESSETIQQTSNKFMPSAPTAPQN